MQKSKINNNFYGIERFRSNPLSIDIKYQMCKYIFIAPSVLAKDARVIANTYITEEHANKLLARLKNEIDNIDKKNIHSNLLDPMVILNWIEVNGLLSICEINDFCDYCGLEFDEYFKQFEKYKMFLVSKDGELYLNYLKQYQSILDANQTDWALDRYLESQKVLTKEDYELIDKLLQTLE